MDAKRCADWLYVGPLMGHMGPLVYMIANQPLVRPTASSDECLKWVKSGVTRGETKSLRAEMLRLPLGLAQAGRPRPHDKSRTTHNPPAAAVSPIKLAPTITTSPAFVVAKHGTASAYIDD
ncbi:hypothetical protein MGU_01614 [Metarhizium guizhouense ARSEF 977]|uniref:Uncharacterized protein n=1 Tax=Metarhizium guizhouense (strain ARSEF 977) TaxID=1276136 RepID=A0A0B4IBK1_METGA|nr:hypothetical protein MGU_01614 [Metarhizium guizhouense ARSEF 977]